MEAATRGLAQNPLRATDEADDPDERLAQAAAAGDRRALEALIKRHRPWIYAIAVRLMVSPIDADDLTQDALIRIVTKIDQFEGRARFRTWAYRIVVRCFLDSKRGRLERVVTSFHDYGASLDAIPLQEVDAAPNAEQALLIEEAKLGCMLGMLLCLEREQRLIFVLGDILACPSPDAAELLDITAATFRKRLERARADLSAFMQEKCGLMNPSNPCRCEKKTRGFIAAGWVDPQELRFTDAHVQRARGAALERASLLDQVYYERAGTLFREHPVIKGPAHSATLSVALSALLEDSGESRPS